MQLADEARYVEAFRLLDAEQSFVPEIRNARGVCLMRTHRYRDALELFKSLVIPHNCTWLKQDLPLIYRTNLITAFMLAKLPQGANAALMETREVDHPSVVRLRRALDEWVKRLPWSKWLQWKYGLDLEEQVTLDFDPGDFVDPLTSPRKPKPVENGKPRWPIQPAA
ncbi:MAG: hypothetical protein CMJ46_01475 [Planctomyces sp.]|nr:hypothetical protein [Planctomyces sp.]